MQASLTVNRRILHIALGLILIACLVCPFVEVAIGWDDTIFSTGYDSEALVAVVTLLTELVFAIASAVIILFVVLDKTERPVLRNLVLELTSGFDILAPNDSPPLALRI